MQKNITIPVRELNEIKSSLISIESKLDKLLAEKEKELLTPDEVCAMLRISRRTYQRHVKDGTIHQIQNGDAPNSPAFVYRAEIEKLINNVPII